MGAEDFTYTSFPMQENPNVLKVTTPEGYTEKDIIKLHENVKKAGRQRVFGGDCSKGRGFRNCCVTK